MVATLLTYSILLAHSPRAIALRAAQGQVVNVAITGAKGMYLVQVLRMVVHKTVKVVKK